MQTRFTSLVILFLMFSLVALPLAGQDIVGRVTDAWTGKPIQGVALVVKGTTKGTATSNKGFFRLSLSGIPAVLVVSHLSYQSKEVTVNSVSDSIIISVEPASYQLKGLDVKPFPVTEVLKGRSLEVLDYEFLGDDLLLLANRNGSMFRPCLVLANMEGDTICSININKPDKLYRDFEGKVYFISRQSVWLINKVEDTLALEYVMNRESFLKSYPFVVDMKHPNWILRQYKYQNQALDYYLYGEDKKQYTVFRSISNDDALARSRWGAYFDGTEADEQFARVIINRPVFAPMFRKGDSLIVLNYLENKLEFYDNDCNELGHVKASFMHEKGCKEEIYKDEVTGKFYVMFLKNGISSLNEINLETGNTVPATKIPGFVYIEKIMIRDHKVFFLYREKINQEQKKIYSLKFRVN